MEGGGGLESLMRLWWVGEFNGVRLWWVGEFNGRRWTVGGGEKMAWKINFQMEWGWQYSVNKLNMEEIFIVHI